MIRLKLLLENLKPIYQGNCIDILDTNSLFNDTTEMAYVDENAVQISKEEFLTNVDFGNEIPLRGKTFWNFENKIFFAYDYKRDVHYFYSR